MAEALLAARPGGGRADRRDRLAGVHPHVGALDVMPVVYLDEDRRGAACAEALGGRRAWWARSCRCRSSSTASWPPGPSTASGRRCGAAARPSWAGGSTPGSCVPDYGPPRAAPHGRGGAGRGAPAAGGLQRRPRDRRPRAGAGDRGGAARVGRRAARRAGDRALPRRTAAARRCRPTCTTTGRCRCATWSSTCARGRRWRRPSWWAWRRAGVRGLSRGRSAAGVRPRASLDRGGPGRYRLNRTPVPSLSMAQTKRKRTRKHRGTPAGTIERAGRTGRPRTREEAKKISRQRRRARYDKPPNWGARSTGRRSPRSCSAYWWWCCSSATSPRVPRWPASCSCSTSRWATSPI